MKISFFSLGLLSLLHPSFAKELDFNRDVRPILSQRCFACHGPDEAKIEGDLQLHTFEHATKKRGKKGEKAPAITPGKVEDSPFWKRITTTDPDDVMPPPSTHQVVSPKEREILRQWIISGAKYEKLWSFKRLAKNVDVPKDSTSSNPIDAFINKSLKEQKLKANQQAKPEVLLRRVYYTLTGLPPTKEQVESFLANPSKEAYEKTVDQLLASKSHAEHLTSEWMDVSRYADSYGYQVDRPRTVWPWKDWGVEEFSLKHALQHFYHASTCWRPHPK